MLLDRLFPSYAKGYRITQICAYLITSLLQKTLNRKSFLSSISYVYRTHTVQYVQQPHVHKSPLKWDWIGIASCLEEEEKGGFSISSYWWPVCYSWCQDLLLPPLLLWQRIRVGEQRVNYWQRMSHQFWKEETEGALCCSTGWENILRWLLRFAKLESFHLCIFLYL